MHGLGVVSAIRCRTIRIICSIHARFILHWLKEEKRRKKKKKVEKKKKKTKTRMHDKNAIYQTSPISEPVFLSYKDTNTTTFAKISHPSLSVLIMLIVPDRFDVARVLSLDKPRQVVLDDERSWLTTDGDPNSFLPPRDTPPAPRKTKRSAHGNSHR